MATDTLTTLWRTLEETDPEIAGAIRDELHRQNSGLERIDYDELERLADEHRPKMIIVGASAYPRVIDFARIRAAADHAGAPMFTDMAHIAGLVAAGVHPSPVPHSDFVTTTTHKTLRGPRGGLVLCPEQYANDPDRPVFPGG